MKPGRKLHLRAAYRHQFEGIIAYYGAKACEAITDKFIAAVEMALCRVVELPETDALYTPPPTYMHLESKKLRQFSLTRLSPFSYTIFYGIQKQIIIIHAIYHQSRNPDLPAGSLAGLRQY